MCRAMAAFHTICYYLNSFIFSFNHNLSGSPEVGSTSLSRWFNSSLLPGWVVAIFFTYFINLR
ncbi:hypothetical protein BH09BAC1_BH09BAC1_12820 [soil metagenome]